MIIYSLHYLLIFKFVNCRRHMTGATSTVIHNAVIFWNQIHVMKNEACIVVELDRFSITDIH